MSNSDRMPLVDFVKDKISKYILDNIRVVEKENFVRWKEFKRLLIGGRISALSLTCLGAFVYTYTMFAVQQECFLDDFEEPEIYAAKIDSKKEL